MRERESNKEREGEEDCVTDSNKEREREKEERVEGQYGGLIVHR